MDLHDNGQCKRVTFGCGHRDDYDKLRKLVFDSEEGYDKASHDKAIERGHDNEVFFVGNRAAVYGCDAEAVPISDEDVIPKLGGHTP
ncbi:hypothetical protein [Burkholderia sp. BCC1972]|uniref:hypothetical protein n=1 Tax=Burkholderia sp. BCC1972 TaxID=2817438 RepID=UPI002ABE3B56|nr:hypothetical protein [Burkholderia sp. BCC1972]